KPKCDFIVKGYAYTPRHRLNNDSFTASLKLQTPNFKTQPEPIAATKYAFVEKKTTKTTKQSNVAGQILIYKTLTILSPRQAINDTSLVNYYQLKVQPMGVKVSLNPKSSFGGYSLIEKDHPALKNISKKELIPEDDRASIRLNPHHGIIAYIEQDDFNAAGSGYYSTLYYKNMKPKRIELSQIHNPNTLVDINIINKMASKALDDETHQNLVAGFGVCAKSHPQRNKLLGTVDQAFIDSDALLPDGFDFAIWNCAYPDQQTSFLTGNEWLTLTNLCKSETIGTTINHSGETELKLYLPEVLAYLILESNDPEMIATELPMKLDTVIVSPELHKVNLVWRSIVISNYQPKSATLAVIDRATQDELSGEYYTQTIETARPYDKGARS
ncbi:DUF2169 domain-containing protein, partial [Psychrobacter celer]|uniref:DUF2169 domain-containing protein n=1 Tax=Psychrobacter celer TaxID=306572 RepID=UPI003FD28C1A